MMGLQYSERALNHWREWRPRAFQAMLKAGTLNREVQQASKEAARQVASLMESGLQLHEAEEIVLPDLILLPPEAETDQPEPTTR